MQLKEPPPNCSQEPNPSCMGSGSSRIPAQSSGASLGTWQRGLWVGVKLG